MVIYLEHAVHGRKVATSEIEAKYDESNGWRRFDPERDRAVTAPEPATSAAPVVVNALATPAPRRGRPPRSVALNH